MRMIDIRLGLDVIAMEVKERVVDLVGRYSFPSPVTSAKDKGVLVQIESMAITLERIEGRVDAASERMD
ncbi:unnamed protein product [Ectocarpus sp. 4 AP-2014]